MKYKHLWKVLVVLIAVTVAPGVILAGDGPQKAVKKKAAACEMGSGCDMITSEKYHVRAPSRLLHGVVNAGLGWTRLIAEPIAAVQDEDRNIVDGIANGFSQSLYYTLVGAWEIGTFWVPGQGGIDIAAKDCVMCKYKECK